MSWLRSSCWPRPGSGSASGSWRRSWPRPRLTWRAFLLSLGPPGREENRLGGRPGPPEAEKALPLALSADGKGVAMRPESRRKRTKAPGKRVKTFQARPGIGEKGHKRVAEVACVFDVIPRARTPEEVMASHHGAGDGRSGTKAGSKPAPEAACRRYRVDIAADRSASIAWL